MVCVFLFSDIGQNQMLSIVASADSGERKGHVHELAYKERSGSL